MERYAAAACQVDFENPRDRTGIRGHADRMIATIRQTVEDQEERMREARRRRKDGGEG